ncbi:hypothetical protein ElyMa_004941600 [Elysia marginata]|uniref:Uncharacterized protein n=1 Tax=Elysia marginata TaxID=1093978 RepID=A0AAV4J2X1_9GAST|nr:hypothetical protein ElyMa_004941600 [Elysia marginata]
MAPAAAIIMFRSPSGAQHTRNKDRRRLWAHNDVSNQSSESLPQKHKDPARLNGTVLTKCHRRPDDSTNETPGRLGTTLLEMLARRWVGMMKVWSPRP